MRVEPDASALPEMLPVWDSAARLQQLVPDAVLVGGSAATLYAAHRVSVDHDRVLGDLASRFDMVLGALQREQDWVTNRVTPGKIILGQLGGIEVGIRQLIRRLPLEVQEVTLPNGATLRVPTAAETLHIKAFLIVKRNQVRDFVDVAALVDRYGEGPSAFELAHIDQYYADPERSSDAVASQLVRQLGDPQPKDRSLTNRLDIYRQLSPRWRDWTAVVEVCSGVAARMISEDWD
jgi:Nucleotidyl transferase AbiEii toxin, Type IV TA system